MRATLGGEQIFDTARARYVWEWPYYPQYYIPADDIDPRFLVDEHHEQRLRQGTARRHGLRAGSLDRPAPCGFGDDAIGGMAGTARFDWDALDAWYEEDEQIFVHPRNPYVRVDALRSHRHVRASLEGITLAETTMPVLVFETGLDLAWAYDYPTRQLLPIANARIARSLRGEDVGHLNVRVFGQQARAGLAERGGDRAVQVRLPPGLVAEGVENAEGGVAEFEGVPGDRAGLGRSQRLGVGQEGGELVFLARLGLEDNEQSSVDAHESSFRWVR